MRTFFDSSAFVKRYMDEQGSQDVALHVACAMEWKAELFVSADKEQIAAARKAGLRTKLV